MKKPVKHKQSKQGSSNETYAAEACLFENLADNENMLRQTFAHCSDLVVHKMTLQGSILCMIIYLQELVDSRHLGEGLLQHLLQMKPETCRTFSALIESLADGTLPIPQTTIIEKQTDAIQCIVAGDVVLFVDSSRQAVSVDVKKQLHRSLEEPSTELLIRGPRIGFVENLNVNISLIRASIRDPQLKIEKMTIGDKTRTDVAITYIEGMAPQSVVDEAKKRLAAIEIDSVLESGYIEELIRDAPYSPFPVMSMTERPDSVSATLLEGKVAIMINGTPMALVVPFNFWFMFHTVEDYYMNYIYATLTRWLRYFFAFVALVLPSVYIALTTFHQEMIPTSLMLSIMSAREVVPFPALMETLIMEITFEALREAGIRLPRAVGQTISIVGALVIGQSAVQAGIISAPIVIIVSLTGIASFMIANNNMNQTIRLLRFPLMISAGILGLFGIGAFMVVLLIHLANLRSFGIPYLSPIAPLQTAGLWDVLVRAPWWKMRKRQQFRHLAEELDKH